MNLKRTRLLPIIMLCLCSVCISTIYAQKDVNKRTITGIVVDESGEPLVGASVIAIGKTQNGTITALNGRFSLNISTEKVLKISYIGYITTELKIENQSQLRITLSENRKSLDEVVVVGYGTQKKESVVGAISTLKGEELLKTGGVTSVGQALQGKIPGVVTMYTNGQPGSQEMQIFIRGQSSWNNTQPLVLVDGIERSMNDIDMNEVAGISVLKDASATAVYGVKGANGVIIITTKRGQTGKAKFSVSANNVFKSISKVPEKYDSYDAMKVTNEAIMRELMYSPTSWNEITPEQVANKYRNQTTQLEREIYPNVDWKEYMFKDYASDSRLNLSLSGGSDFAKYFCSLAYETEGDMVKDFNNNKGYSGSMTYKRFNYRSNLDFNITKSTTFAVNLSGSYGIQTSSPADKNRLYLSLYNLAPDLYYPRYSDGTYGYTTSLDLGLSNALYYYTSDGLETNHNIQLNTDFTLTQKLDFVTRGLSLLGKFSFDNNILANQSIIDDNNVIFKRYDNDGTMVSYQYPSTTSGYSYVIPPWTTENLTSTDKVAFRRTNYQLSLNYGRTFGGKHNVSGLLLFKREEYAKGSDFPHFYEDWVGRATYDFNKTYFLELNGAYNGSEKFGPDFRFNLFPSTALGWMISNEPFMKNLKWLDKLKIRASVGQVGDDGGSNIARWLYVTQWGSMNTSAEINNSTIYTGAINSNGASGRSPYSFYLESALGSANAHWETSLKKDIGLEMSVLNGEIKAEVDYFEDNRRDIFVAAGDRSVPEWFGAKPVGANVGKVDVKGYEIVLNFNHSFTKDFRMFADINYSHAKDVVIYSDDPYLKASYQKKAGYSIGQTRSAIGGAMMQNWDDIYMSTPLSSGNDKKRPGYYDLVDFNGDGNYNGTFDDAPYGYPNRPQNNWSTTVGCEYKEFSLSVQFFGQNNTTRSYRLNTFPLQTHTFFAANGNYWSKQNPTGTQTLYTWRLLQGNMDPYKELIDASQVRLKTVELAYRFNKRICKKLNLDGLRLFFNGNNLLLWTKMADDRDYNEGTTNSRGDYPTLKRFNFGFNLDF